MPVHCVETALGMSGVLSLLSDNSFVNVSDGLQTEHAVYALLFASANVVAILLWLR